jgi:uncharacterized protein (DUF2267 family)
MSRTGLEVFDRTLQLTHTWLKRVMEELHIEDRQQAYRALRATLHALRDRLTVEEAAHLGAQLPMLVRGFYYDEWNPVGKPLKERSREQFLGHVRDTMRDPRIDPERAVRAVFTLLTERIAEGEIADVKQMLPGPVRELWPS